MGETVITVNSANQTTTSVPSSAGPFSWIVINVDYFKGIPGIIKIVQFVLGIICMILASPPHIGATTFFIFVVVVAFIATILWSAAYFLGIREAFTLPINWVLTETINTGILALLYVIASIIQLSSWSRTILSYSSEYGSNIAAGVLGLFNCLAYVAGTYFLYLELRLGGSR